MDSLAAWLIPIIGLPDLLTYWTNEID